MKKRVLALLLGTVLTAGVFAGCSSSPEPEKTDDSQKTEGEAPSTKEESTTIKIGASPAPHAEILQQAKDALAAEGINIEILEFSDYILPNTALDS